MAVMAGWHETARAVLENYRAHEDTGANEQHSDNGSEFHAQRSPNTDTCQPFSLMRDM
jgi:hypothetical protein